MNELRKLSKNVSSTHEKKKEATGNYFSALENKQKCYQEVSDTWEEFEAIKNEIHEKFPKSVRWDSKCTIVWREFLIYEKEKKKERAEIAKKMEDISVDLLIYKEYAMRIEQIDRDIEMRRESIRRKLGFYELMKKRNDAFSRHNEAKKNFEKAKREARVKYRIYEKAMDNYIKAEKALDEYQLKNPPK